MRGDNFSLKNHRLKCSMTSFMRVRDATVFDLHQIIRVNGEKFPELRSCQPWQLKEREIARPMLHKPALPTSTVLVDFKKEQQRQANNILEFSRKDHDDGDDDLEVLASEFVSSSVNVLRASSKTDRTLTEESISQSSEIHVQNGLTTVNEASQEEQSQDDRSRQLIFAGSERESAFEPFN